MDSCNIKVAIKVRPLNHRELLDGRVYWKVESDSLVHVDPFSEKKNGDQFFFGKLWFKNFTLRQRSLSSCVMECEQSKMLVIVDMKVGDYMLLSSSIISLVKQVLG